MSAVLLIGIGVFWLVHPAASEGALSIVPDSDAARRYASLAAVFKAVGDILPPVFVLLALGLHQFRLAGWFHVVTLVLIIAVDMITCVSFVPDPGPQHVLMHVPFAIPMLVAAACFLAQPPTGD